MLYVRFEVYTAVTMKNAVFWDVAAVCSHLLNAGSSLADFSPLKMEAIRSSETSVHTRSTRRHIPEDGILSLRISSLQVLHYVLLISLP
jgi:hypothetical protein